LGAELLSQQDVPLQTGTPQPGCLWFAETNHNVCNQAVDDGFLAYWQRNGLQNAAPDPYGQSLALFGLPLTEAYETIGPNGERILVQWFERARFEWHPTNPPQSRVLLGRLGAELQQGGPVVEQPPTETTAVWQGQTAALQRVVLTIQNNAVQAVLITVNIEGERADAIDETPPERDNDLPIACSTPVLYIKSAFDSAGLAPIQDNSFSFTLEDEDTVFYMSGTLEGPNVLSGVAQLRTKPARRYVCLGVGSTTWQAAPDGAGPPGTASEPAPPPPGATRGRAPAPPDQPPPSPPSEPAPPQLPTTSTAECPATPDPAAAIDDPLRIVDVDKKIEIVTLQNVSGAQVDLTGWKICSVTGNQLHASLQGILEAGETRSFVSPGAAIWSNDEPDDGALYDPLGNLVSYWDDPAN
jgi:hypothetical protein